MQALLVPVQVVLGCEAIGSMAAGYVASERFLMTELVLAVTSKSARLGN